MQKLDKKTLQDSLLSARQNALKEANKHLTQHEDFRGMKIYSWSGANLNECFDALKQLDNPVIWIMSSDLEHDFNEERPWLNQEVEAIISFGQANKKFRYDLEAQVTFFTRKNDILEACEMLTKVAHEGNTVFFAPGLGTKAKAMETTFLNYLKDNQ